MAIAVGYFAVATLWIYGSDRLVSLLAAGDPRVMEWLQLVKGEAFVVGTAVALGFAVARLNARTRRVQEEKLAVEEMLHVAKRMEALGTLAGSIVHDFNNLITIVGGMLQLVEMDAEEGAPANPHLQEAQRAIERAAQLNRQLMLFMRGEPHEYEVGDVGELVNRVSGVLRQAVGSRVRFNVIIGGDLPPVRFLRAQVEGTLLNLVVNARDAIGQDKVGEVSLRVESRLLDDYTTVFRDLPVSGRFVVLTVADNGAGIHPLHHTRVFAPFYTTKPAGKGSGLGLASALRVVQELGGWIELESDVGKGARFQLFLPAVALGEESERAELFAGTAA